MIEQLATAATFGFGASFGRDLYRAAKKNPIIWVIIGILMIAFGWRNLYLGLGRGPIYKFFVTFLGSAILIVVGTVGFLAVGLLAMEEMGNVPMLIALGIILVSTIAGNIWGINDRKKQIQAAKIAKQNQDFMIDIGLKDSDFDTDLLQDADGNLLRQVEQTSDKIVFSVSGKRGYRAAIKLENGRMVEYTGIVKL